MPLLVAQQADRRQKRERIMNRGLDTARASRIRVSEAILQDIDDTARKYFRSLSAGTHSPSASEHACPRLRAAREERLISR